MKSGIVLSLLVLSSCAMKINGKTYGGGGGGDGAAGTIAGGGGDGRAPDVQFDPDKGIEAYPTAPVDPWAAVDGDGPRRVSADEIGYLKVRNRPHDCTAANDHCLLKLSWFIESEGARATKPTYREAVPAVFGPDGPGQPWNVRAQTPPTHGGYTAYRTVPATRALLAKGALVVALGFPVTSPATGGGAYEHTWNLGVVERVDWAGGKLYLVAREEPFLISAARVAVLSWAPGGKVTILGKRTRDQLAVARADVILPAQDRGKVADPWAAVGQDKQPLRSDDADPILTDTQFACDAAHDHCLRAWTWFVESNGRGVPARWNGKAFAYPRDATHLVDNPGMAYRTVPATAANLKAGATVVVFDHGSFISHERDALSNPWRLAKVKAVQADAGLITLEDGDHVGFAHARVAVLMWFPGEQAEAM